jgi:hypothetical protein
MEIVETTSSTKTTNNYENKELEKFIEGNYIGIKDGETRVLQFLPNKTKIVEKNDFNGKPTKRVQFTAIDINDAQRLEKIFELSRMHVGKIYDELKKGKTVLEISRFGSAKETRYLVKAVR